MNDSSPSQAFPILLYLIAGVLGASGQYLYKMGAQRLASEPIYRNWPIFSGMALFCVVMVLFVLGFKAGGKMSVVYPIYATTFVWGTLIAVWLDKEPVSLTQWMGIATIVVGVSLIAIGHR